MARHTPGPWTIGKTDGNRTLIEPGIALVLGLGRAPAANARVLEKGPELLGMLRHLCDALDMSDVDHEDFRDSCADVVEHLWLQAAAARALLAHIEGD